MARTGLIGQLVNLDITIKNSLGQPTDADQLPSVQIVDSNGATKRVYSASGVLKMATGEYRLPYSIPSTGPVGTWTDSWRSMVNGILITGAFSFSVLNATLTMTADPGPEIGDAVTETWTDPEIDGINILMKIIKARLRNNNQSETVDAFGNKTLTDCYIFTDSELEQFLKASLSEFNQTPHRTNFSFADQIIYETHAYIIAEGAYILAIASQMLIEAGREFTINDNGITMQPPPLSSTLNNQFGTLLTRHTDMLKYIKTSMKPGPRGIGTYRVLAIAPAYLRLRHLRERKIV